MAESVGLGEPQGGRRTTTRAAETLILPRRQLVATEEALQDFSDDVATLWCRCGTVTVLDDGPPTPLEFLRDHVAVSRPCVIRGAFPDPSHPTKPLVLSLDQLCGLLAGSSGPEPLRLAVDVTPDGHGDCLRSVRTPHGCHGGEHHTKEGGQDSTSDNDEDGDGKAHARRCFVKPQTVEMDLDEFRWRLRRNPRRTGGRRSEPSAGIVSDRIFEESVPQTAREAPDDRVGKPPPAPLEEEGSVVYYSRQNDCLRREVSPLWDLELFPKRVPWAEEAFRQATSDDSPQPDAVNLWIGNESAVSALHKDPYENLFYVLSGEKVFTLCPPSDACFLEEQLVPSGSFEWDGCDWKVRLDAEDTGDQPSEASILVPWIATDLTVLPDARPPGDLARLCHPIEVRVRAGELLYLPALWFHRVTQSCETIAINYWYDMRFESPNWCYFRFLQQLQKGDTAS